MKILSHRPLLFVPDGLGSFDSVNYYCSTEEKTGCTTAEVIGIETTTCHCMGSDDCDLSGSASVAASVAVVVLGVVAGFVMNRA